MPDPKVPQDVEIEQPVETPEELSEVVVDLEKKPEPPKQEAEKQSPELTRLNNTIAYQNRKLEQAMRDLQETKRLLSERAVQPVQKEQPVDEIDELAQRDWKQGVKKLVESDIESKVQAILEKRDQAQRELYRKSSLETELEKSKNKVREKYPQIEDDTTEEASLYRQVINEDTTILQNIHGPEIAMYRMEERMRQMGKTPPSVKPIVDREVNRLTRAGVSSVVGTKPTGDGKITLSKDQKEFCDHYNIPYEQYAKNLKADPSRGVEI